MQIRMCSLYWGIKSNQFHHNALMQHGHTHVGSETRYSINHKHHTQTHRQAHTHHLPQHDQSIAVLRRWYAVVARPSTARTRSGPLERVRRRCARSIGRCRRGRRGRIRAAGSHAKPCAAPVQTTGAVHGERADLAAHVH